jgi:hypothetical protein
MKYITTPCSENRIFCDVQASDRTAAMVFENKLMCRQRDESLDEKEEGLQGSSNEWKEERRQQIKIRKYNNDV